jgi:hypothetical protein
MVDNKIISIKKIFRIIDSCTNFEQLNTCKNIASLYAKLAYSNGVVNPEAITNALNIHINEKREEMGMAFQFNGMIRRKKAKIVETIESNF